MDQSLSLLVLISLCSFKMCHNYEFHFINESKTWCEAQTFCRQHYTDLVTFNNMMNMTQICEEENYCRNAWIGLYNKNNSKHEPETRKPENKTWHWSLPGQEYSESEAQWNTTSNPPEPNDAGGNENCVTAKYKWYDVPCCSNRSIICYDNSTKNYTLINEKKTWFEAVQFCRKDYTDLVSGLDQFNDPAFNRTIGTEQPWIGLFRDTWGWSDGSNSSFRNWKATGNYNVLCNTTEQKNNCAKLGDNNKWMNANCSEENPFICYDNHMILIEQKKTWEEALFYCRQNHYDLAWITDEHLQRMVQERAKKADTESVWVGLFYSCFLETWVWGDGEWVVYSNWKDAGFNDCNVSGAVQKGGKNKWVNRPPKEKNNFVCIV